ncbi:hypothetical protein QWZ13_04545 [Reinekea marina]|uniref:Fibronectin type-III domain-containing protein n=1 Tax=Reinekea marina TaxID=1310421 RepID=A0ABV7WQL9_9GAMM|nr:hypothetical protein [Reinekea marina]MBU2863946.1 hypothetical protein [Reinekea forsetii]MDN3648174.1 hypothetical protein [Reinekea marina]
MKTQLTLIATLLTVALTGCQVEGLTAQGNAATDNETVAVTDPTSNTTPDTEPTVPVDEETPTNTTGTVTLYWSAPVERVNGQSMDMLEVGGYEIRYKLESDETYTNVVIDGLEDQYTFLDLENAEDYQFEVAVFDTDGIYSDFVVAMAN